LAERNWRHLFLHPVKREKLLTEVEGHLAHALLWELLELWEGLFNSCHAG